MSENIIVSCISLIGTLAGTFGGIMVSMKMVLYRIERLEDAVKENRQMLDRVYRLEEHNHVQDTRLEQLFNDHQRMIMDIKEMKRNRGEHSGN